MTLALYRFGSALLLSSVILTSSVFAQRTQSDNKPSTDRLKDNYELMRMFAETFEQIDQNYVKDLDRRELMEAAIQGMLQRLDQYSTYIPRTRMDQFTQSVEQEYGGIGIRVEINENRELTVVTPLPGGPAYFAGVRSGDRIIEIKGESAVGFSTNDAVEKLKGPRGGEVKIGVRRAGSGRNSEIETISLVRDIIQLETVLGNRFSDGKWDFMLDKANKIGYVRLTHFSRKSADELRDAMETLTENGMKGLVLDLRDNPGGLLSQATQIADMFIEEGKIVSTKGRNVPEQSWNATKPGTFSGFPMAIIVNRISASASEIVSACLQDQKRAIVVGERSWGKGSVQNVIDLEQGRSALKLTTASYFRPSGRNIHRFPDSTLEDEWGVSPDEGYDVRFTRTEFGEWRVARRDGDIIREGDQAGTSESNFVDRQLKKAMEYVAGKIAGTNAKSESKSDE